MAFGSVNISGTYSWDDIDGKPSSFPPESHDHDDRYYAEDEVRDLLSGKLDLHGTADNATKWGGTYQLRLNENKKAQKVLVEAGGAYVDWRDVAEIAGLNGVAVSGSSYIRFTDGTQICWAMVPYATLPEIASGESIQRNITYPVAFQDYPALSLSLSGGDSNMGYTKSTIHSVGHSGKTMFSYIIKNASEYTINPGASWVAIGRWK